MLPHELLFYLQEKGDLNIVERDPHTQQLLEAQAKALDVDADNLFPLSLWGDGVSYSKKKTLFVVSIGVNPALQQARYPVVLLPDKNEEILKQVFNILHWSITVSATGCFPEQRQATLGVCVLLGKDGPQNNT